jgi:hypothetical protein
MPCQHPLNEGHGGMMLVWLRAIAAPRQRRFEIRIGLETSGADSVVSRLPRRRLMMR